MTLMNDDTRTYRFLQEMESDSYFPAQLVARGKRILQELCLHIEAQGPQTEDELFALTRVATEAFNALSVEFEEQGSEIETGARENIGRDFAFIARAYGFEVSTEDLMDNREW